MADTQLASGVGSGAEKERGKKREIMSSSSPKSKRV